MLIVTLTILNLNKSFINHHNDIFFTTFMASIDWEENIKNIFQEICIYTISIKNIKKLVTLNKNWKLNNYLIQTCTCWFRLLGSLSSRASWTFSGFAVIVVRRGSDCIGAVTGVWATCTGVGTNTGGADTGSGISGNSLARCIHAKHCRALRGSSEAAAPPDPSGTSSNATVGSTGSVRIKRRQRFGGNNWLLLFVCLILLRWKYFSILESFLDLVYNEKINDMWLCS